MMKKLLIALAALVAAAGVCAGAALMAVERAVSSPAVAGEAPGVEIDVAKGATGRTLGAVLHERGLVGSRWAWRYHLWRRGGLVPKAGKHLVRASMTMPELCAALEAPPIPEDEPFVVVEGWRLRDTDAALAHKGWIIAGDYVKAACDPARYQAPFPLPTTCLEGYLYPETYRVVPGAIDVRTLVQRQLDIFVSRFWQPHKDELERSGRPLAHVVTLASLLEREEPVPAQRALVAGILWKRLDKPVPLGVDATSRYELAEWNDRKAFLKKLRDAGDPWNTRTRTGLPPGPLGAVTLDSLLAALRPQASDFWYYLHDAGKKLHPSRNAGEHEALRAQHNVY